MTMLVKSFWNHPLTIICLVIAHFSVATHVPASTPHSKSQPVSPTRTNAEKDQAEVHSIKTDMGPIMTLLFNHDKVKLTIQNIPGGVRTITTSTDPEIVKAIRTHSLEMKARMDQGNVIRPNDPLFAELFRRHKEIKVVLRDIPNGVLEDETSKNAQVALLIHAHSQRVAGFVREGLPATRQNSPLPQGYHATEPAPSLSNNSPTDSAH